MGRPRPISKKVGQTYLFNPLICICPPHITRGPREPAAGRVGLQARKPKKK